MAHFQNWIVTVAKQSVADISSAENQRKSHAFFYGWKLAALAKASNYQWLDKK